MPHLQTSAGRVAFAEVGTGPILMLLHATLHDRRDYDPVLAALAASHRVMAVDWPGHGESDADAGSRPVTAALLADVLEEVVLAQDLRDVRLIGNSVGGFGANNPVTRTFCRVMGTPAVARRIMPRFINGYMRPKTASDHAIVKRTVARARTPDGTALAASMWRSFATPEHDLREQADQLTAPTQIVWGRQDKALPLSAGRATHKRLSHSKMDILDTGHVVFSSEPEAFLRIVEPFLASLPVEAPTDGGARPSRGSPTPQPT